MAGEPDLGQLSRNRVPEIAWHAVAPVPCCRAVRGLGSLAAPRPPRRSRAGPPRIKAELQRRRYEVLDGRPPLSPGGRWRWLRNLLGPGSILVLLQTRHRRNPSQSSTVLAGLSRPTATSPFRAHRRGAGLGDRIDDDLCRHHDAEGQCEVPTASLLQPCSFLSPASLDPWRASARCPRRGEVQIIVARGGRTACIPNDAADRGQRHGRS